MTPDQLRELATEIILDQARDVEYLSIAERLEHLDLPDREDAAACEAIADLIAAAVVIVAWPEATTTQGTSAGSVNPDPNETFGVHELIRFLSDRARELGWGMEWDRKDDEGELAQYQIWLWREEGDADA